MAGKKGKSGGARENAGRHSKAKERKGFQIMAYPETIQAIKDFKLHCIDNELDFVEELNKRVVSSLIVLPVILDQ